MAIKTTLNYSPNFDLKKRRPSKIKFIILHYTGMKNESNAIRKLTNINSKVSCHYFIKNNGEIVTMVPDLYVAWHAGKSSWKNFNSLNKNSIGIEISNPGHNFYYRKFSKNQIISLVKLNKLLIKKYKINLKNVLGHSDIAPERKKDPGEKFPWKFFSKKKICFWHNLNQIELRKTRGHKISAIEEKMFIKNLFKIGYSKKATKNFNFNKQIYYKIITKAFQRRFRQELVNGKIDKECFIISKNLI
jgi:N-acetylmuramoyl-L-alanine amidase